MVLKRSATRCLAALLLWRMKALAEATGVMRVAAKTSLQGCGVPFTSSARIIAAAVPPVRPLPE